MRAYPDKPRWRCRTSTNPRAEKRLAPDGEGVSGDFVFGGGGHVGLRMFGGKDSWLSVCTMKTLIRLGRATIGAETPLMSVDPNF